MDGCNQKHPRSPLILSQELVKKLLAACAVLLFTVFNTLSFLNEIVMNTSWSDLFFIDGDESTHERLMIWVFPQRFSYVLETPVQFFLGCIYSWLYRLQSWANYPCRIRRQNEEDVCDSAHLSLRNTSSSLQPFLILVPMSESEWNHYPLIKKYSTLLLAWLNFPSELLAIGIEQ